MIGTGTLTIRCTLFKACARVSATSTRVSRPYSTETDSGKNANSTSRQEEAGNSGGQEKPNPANNADGADAKSSRRIIPEVPSMDGAPNLFIFRLERFIPELPLVMRDAHRLPAMGRWFEPRRHGHVFTPRLTKHSQTVFPYELTDPAMRPDSSASSSSLTDSAPPALPLPYVLTEFRNWLVNRSNESYLPLLALIAGLTDPAMAPERAPAIDGEGEEADYLGEGVEFRQFYGPLGLLARACEFNETRRTAAERLQRLYIAQAPVDSLPAPLGGYGTGPKGGDEGAVEGAGDLPTPDLVRSAGRGDIYGSSVWLGLEPTYTPPHRDPNPNLFCQLLGEKHVRLLPPDRGDALYNRVRRRCGLRDGNARFRGPEMMGGAEREALERAVWDDDGVVEDGDEGLVDDMQQTVLRPGDSIFIPKGWWHSIRSNGAGVLNASVNWWFR